MVGSEHMDWVLTSRHVGLPRAVDLARCNLNNAQILDSPDSRFRQSLSNSSRSADAHVEHRDF